MGGLTLGYVVRAHKIGRRNRGIRVRFNLFTRAALRELQTRSDATIRAEVDDLGHKLDLVG